MYHLSLNQCNQNISSDSQWNQVSSENQWNQVCSNNPQPNGTISANNPHYAPIANYYPDPTTNAYGSTNDANISYISVHPIQHDDNSYNSNDVWSGAVVNKDHVTSRTTCHNTIPKSRIIKKGKRVRTAFTTDQIMYLEAEFKRSQYLEHGKRLQVAQTLNLNERAVKLWFQNRRMKAKKELIESRENEAACTTETLPDPQQQFGDQPFYTGPIESPINGSNHIGWDVSWMRNGQLDNIFNFEIS